MIDDFNWDMVLIQYNYLDVNAQAGIRGIRYAYENDVAIFVMEPLKGGLLAGELPKEVSDLFDSVDSNKSSVEWALSWVLNQKEITCVLSGMGSLEQIKENMDIAKRVEVDSLSDEELDILDKAQAIFNSMMKINCTGCGYCLPCPKGVNIPEGNAKTYTVAYGLYNMVHTAKGNATAYFAQFVAGCVIIAIPITILFVFMQKFYVNGITAGADKG